jgi:hypothetical protein
MRLPVLIAVLAVATPAALCAGSASAQFFEGQSVLFGRSHVYQGRWCAYNNTGADRVEEDCSFNSFEACNREASLNRGFCTQNPAYVGPAAPAVRNKKRRARH